MHVNLSPELEDFINSKVASGFYDNATEVIRDALWRMQNEEAGVAAWHAAIAKGDAQLDRGEGIVYTPALLDQLTHEALKSLHNGSPMDADVLP